MENTGGSGSSLGLNTSTPDDDYLYFDPKVTKTGPRSLKSSGRGGSMYQDAIVFMVGGGNYIEYQNLQALQGPSRKITYGSTEILNAKMFLAQLSKLS